MRDLYLILGMAAVALVIGVGLFFFGPSSLQSDVDNAVTPGSSTIVAPVNFTVLGQGPLAYSVADRSNYRVTTEADFESLWTLIYGSVDSTKIPHVDFTKYEVLAVFDGTHSTSGYQISVSGVQDQQSVRTIIITHEVPGPTCQVQAGQTSPFELIEVPATAFSLAHQDQTSTTTCQ